MNSTPPFLDSLYEPNIIPETHLESNSVEQKLNIKTLVQNTRFGRGEKTQREKSALAYGSYSISTSINLVWVVSLVLSHHEGLGHL